MGENNSEVLLKTLVDELLTAFHSISEADLAAVKKLKNEKGEFPANNLLPYSILAAFDKLWSFSAEITRCRGTTPQESTLDEFRKVLVSIMKTNELINTEHNLYHKVEYLAILVDTDNGELNAELSYLCTNIGIAQNKTNRCDSPTRKALGVKYNEEIEGQIEVGTWYLLADSSSRSDGSTSSEEEEEEEAGLSSEEDVPETPPLRVGGFRTSSPRGTVSPGNNGQLTPSPTRPVSPSLRASSPVGNSSPATPASCGFFDPEKAAVRGFSTSGGGIACLTGGIVLLLLCPGVREGVGIALACVGIALLVYALAQLVVWGNSQISKTNELSSRPFTI